ncbi:hypothetical protein Tco_0973818, partial [Tanacetum coccineum]
MKAMDVVLAELLIECGNDIDCEGDGLIGNYVKNNSDKYAARAAGGFARGKVGVGEYSSGKEVGGKVGRSDGRIRFGGVSVGRKRKRKRKLSGTLERNKFFKWAEGKGKSRCTQVLTKCQDSSRSVWYRSLPKQIGAIRGTQHLFYQRNRWQVRLMEETPPPLMKEQIEGHVSALKSLIKSHNRKNKGDPIRLDFEMVDTEVQGHNVVKGKEVTDEDLRKPFKEAQRTPFTSRIIEFTDLREAFAARFSVRRVCFKEPHEITKIIRKANESLIAFKERWKVETSFIMGVPKVMKISSFMDSVKSPELAKRFSNKVPTMVNEMMERLDDFLWSEEAYASTELPKGETGESHHKISLPFNGRDTRSFRNTRPVESRRDEYKNSYRGRDTYRP